MSVAVDARPNRPAATIGPVELPAGFRAGGGTAGLKPSGRPDLALLCTERPAPVAAVFTTNRLPAAPITLSRRHLASSAPEGGGGYGWTRAIVCTSGSANAATGPAGDADQAAIAHAVGAAIGAPPEHTLALSTGLIGTRLAVERVRTELDRLAGRLGSGPADLEAAARALMTTDTRPKWAAATAQLPGPDGRSRTIRVAGIAKGVGMMHPRMATMLAVLLTDATVDPQVLHRILRGCATRTWNQLTVDGDTSTNDTVFLWASGASGAAELTGEADDEAYRRLAGAVGSVARSLARQQAADGEGATTLITCAVTGAADDVAARAVARSVVASALVKAAVHGRDPNWGRVIAAAGNARIPDAQLLEAAGLSPSEAAARSGASVPLEASRLHVRICGRLVFAGEPVAYDAADVSRAMAAPEVTLDLELGQGDGSGEAFGCDLTEAYVHENSAYTT